MKAKLPPDKTSVYRKWRSSKEPRASDAERRELGWYRWDRTPARPSRVQELCESRGGRPGLSVLTSLMVSVDVKQHWTMHTHWSQFVPNMSTRHPRTLSSLHYHRHTCLPKGYFVPDRYWTAGPIFSSYVDFPMCEALIPSLKCVRNTRLGGSPKTSVKSRWILIWSSLSLNLLKIKKRFFF